MKLHTKGMPPLDAPVMGRAIGDKLRAERSERALAGPTRFRCSDANGCARKIAYQSLGVPKDVQYSAESLVAFRAGDAYHQMAQEAAVRSVNARCELPVDWTPTASLSGHCDGVYRLAELKALLDADHPILADLRARGAKAADVVAMEVKSMAGWGFRLATGTATKAAELPGPKLADLLQCGMYALAPQVEARWLHMVYIDKDRNLTAEWIIGADEPLAHLGDRTVRELVAEELERLNAIEATIVAGDLPARDVPGYGRVIVPPERDSRDDPWQCRFCSWQPSCAESEEGPVTGWVSTYLATKKDEVAA